MQKHFFIPVAMLSLVFFLQCSSDERALNKKLNEMATSLNESVPVMLDQYTRFDEATVTSENIFQYRYTVLNSSDPDSLVINALRHLEDGIQREFSTNPQLQLFKENNVVLEYIYSDEKGQVLRTLQIQPEDYH